MAMSDEYVELSTTTEELNAAQKARKEYTNKLSKKASNFIKKVCPFLFTK